MFLLKCNEKRGTDARLLLKLRSLQDSRRAADQISFVQGKLMPNLLTAGSKARENALGTRLVVPDNFLVPWSNLISAFFIIMLLQFVTPHHELLLISSPRYRPIQRNTPNKPPSSFFFSRESHNHFPRTLFYFKQKICNVIPTQ